MPGSLLSSNKRFKGSDPSGCRGEASPCQRGVLWGIPLLGMSGVFCSRGVTEGLDGSPQAVAARLRQLLPSNDIFCLTQVHADRIVWAGEVSPEDFPKADGIMSRDPVNVLCIRTADCVPVLLWADDSPMIGAVHAGWRGLSLGIVHKAVGLMRVSGARLIHVSMGPSIGPCCYAVGTDVIDALDAQPNLTLDGRLSVDLHRVATCQAHAAGVPADMIHCVQVCTQCNRETFFSYRRDSGNAGRNISLIGGASCSLPGLQVP